jgi:hypothetical protein
VEQKLGVSPSPIHYHDHCPECFSALLRAQTVEPEKPTRKYAELLQEIRIAQGGSQVLIAYLMSLAFTSRFAAISRLERIFYLAALVLSVAAMAQLVAPAVFRHLTFRHRSESQITVAAGRCIQSGLAMLMCSIVCTLMFSLYSVFQLPLALSVTVGVFIWFVVWWYMVPVWIRARPASISQGRHR